MKKKKYKKPQLNWKNNKYLCNKNKKKNGTNKIVQMTLWWKKNDR